jgi:NADP-dependent 3-hydroxy acid dehydrogenase YdfG
MLGVTVKFPKKRAFVTGAASGLGRALCRRLAGDGWKIAMCDTNTERLAEAAKEVQGLGGDVFTYVLDVTDRATYRDVIAKFLDVAGGVDLVFNNAGVAGGGALGEYTLEDWDWLIQINLMGVVNGCHLFTPILKEQRSGHVINTASAAALLPVPRMSAYCCAKTAVKMLSEIMHNEMLEFGVGVTVLMPEFFQTNLWENTRGENAKEAKALITKSKYTADDVAAYALDCVAAGDLWVTFPKHVRVLWWIKRLSPALINRILRARTTERLMTQGSK